MSDLWWLEAFLRRWHRLDRHRGLRSPIATSELWHLADRPPNFTDGMWRLARLGIVQPESRFSTWGHPVWSHWRLL